MSVKIFFCVFKTKFIILVQIIYIITRVQKLLSFMICGTYFLCQYNFIHYILNDFVVFLLTVNIFFLVTGMFSLSLLVLLLAYLVLKSSRTILSSEECPCLWMRKFLICLSGYLHTFFCACQRSHPSWVESMTSMLFLFLPDTTRTIEICPSRFFNKKGLIHLCKYTQKFPYAQTY